jgi:hypothetical protein
MNLGEAGSCQRGLQALVSSPAVKTPQSGRSISADADLRRGGDLIFPQFPVSSKVFPVSAEKIPGSV